jgi:hypothetical protein
MMLSVLRRLVAVAPVVSLLLFVATVAVWILHYPFWLSWITQRPLTRHRVGFNGYSLFWLREDDVSEAQILAALSQAKTNPEKPGWAGLQRSEVTLGLDGTPGTETDGVYYYIGRGTISLHLDSQRWYFVSLSQPLGNWWEIDVTWWLPTLTFLFLPAIAVRRLVRKANGFVHNWFSRPDGLCVNCRYNLTGNTSGTCPECGTAIPTGERTRNKTPR